MQKLWNNMIFYKICKNLPIKIFLIWNKKFLIPLLIISRKYPLIIYKLIITINLIFIWMKKNLRNLWLNKMVRSNLKITIKKYSINDPIRKLKYNLTNLLSTNILLNKIFYKKSWEICMKKEYLAFYKGNSHF